MTDAVNVPQFLVERGKQPPTNPSRGMTVIEMKKLEQELVPTVSGPMAYAHPEKRRILMADDVSDKVTTFSELPTKALDDVLAEARNKLNLLEQDAQTIRDAYAKHTKRLKEAVLALQEEVDLGLSATGQLKEQLTKRSKPPENE